METIIHAIPPVYDSHSEVLILGTMPSPKSREVGFFYGHPQNRFWRVLARLFDEPVADTNDRRRDQLLRHHIALWDVLASCDIKGASDASIANACPNDLRRITSTADIRAIFCTGAKSAQLYRRFCEQEIGLPCVQLPSTSPANAAWRLDDLVGAYQAILPWLHAPHARVLPVADVVQLERTIDARGTSLAELMDRAGLWLAYRIHQLNATGTIAVLCGNGNNGGDGWVALRHLTQWGHKATLICAKDASQLRAEPTATAAAMTLQATADCKDVRILVEPSDEEVGAALASSDIIVDCLLGTGFAGDVVKEPFATWIRLANESRTRGALIVSADVPSGLHADTGRAATTTVHADETVTMIASKPGIEAAPEIAGSITIAQLAYLEAIL